MNGPILLGIDGGGTSTIAWLADADGNVLGRGASSPSNAKSVGLDAAFLALAEAISDAFRNAGEPPRTVDAACLGLAGFGRPADQRLLREWTSGAEVAHRVVTVTDGDLVVAAGTPEGWGIGLIAGTGSIAVGCNRNGQTARAGGWGPLIGDEGSAYAVVLAALRRIARQADGRDSTTDTPDALATHLFAALGISDITALIPALHAPTMDRARIAALAPAVLAASRDDPAIVSDLLIPAGRALAEMAGAVARTLGCSAGPLPLACAGGFLLAADEVLSSTLAHLEHLGYTSHATLVPEPVRGAICLARQSLFEP